MAMEIRPVRAEEKETLRNLLEKYMFEFSQWDGQEMGADGMYGYQWLDLYWKEPNRWAYFALVDGRIAGFALVCTWPELERKTDFSLAEFCVVPKYRRAGVGMALALEVFRRHQGTWQLRRHPKNTVSVRFWDEATRRAAQGPVEVVSDDPGARYDDGTIGEVLYFDSYSL